jgi:MFS family permease
VGIATTLVIPQVAKPRYRIPILVGIFLIAGGSALMVAMATGALMTVGLLLQGAAGRGAQPIIMLVLMDAPQVGGKHMGAAGGLYFTAGEVGGVMGPLMLGILADQTGGFTSGLVILAGLCVFLVMLTVALGVALRTGSRRITATPDQQSEGSSIRD